MGRMENAIKLLQHGIDAGDAFEAKIMQEVINILSESGSKPEDGDEIDRLTAANVAAEEEISGCSRVIFSQGAEIDRLKAENDIGNLALQGMAKANLQLEIGNLALQGMAKANLQLENELKAKDNRIEELLGEVDACRAVIEEQALEKGSATEGTEVTEKKQ